MKRDFYTVDQVAELLAAQGDDRSLDARRMHVHRAREAGAFPHASKLNPGETSPWLLPSDEVEAWLEKVDA